MNDEPPVAVRAAPTDNVATLLAPAAANAEVVVRAAGAADASGDRVRARAPIDRGHKVALEAIAAGATVVKYGVAFGRARQAIAPGEHVHVHNVESLLGTRAAATGDDGERLVPAERLRARVGACLEAAGAVPAAAAATADALVEAHLRGVETHGVRRLAPYVRRLRAGGVAARAEPRIEGDGSVLHVDGRNAIGHYVATSAADALTRAAHEHGAAVALVRHSSHFGFAGYYATRIAQAGCAALVTSNGQVMVGPDGARRALFSNDPLAIAGPLADGSCFELDMAFSGTSRARLVQAAERGEAVPEGLALDASGSPTTDAAAAAAGILLPFGGTRGFALLAAVEMLAGVLGGGGYADRVASKEAGEAVPEDASHFLLAIDLERAGGRERFAERMRDLIERIHALPLREGLAPLRYPGERRWRLRAQRLAGGIPLSGREASDLDRLCDELGVQR